MRSPVTLRCWFISTITPTGPAIRMRTFARELLELFTLGEGHYTEDDIKETARAFTGWGIDRQRGEHLLRPRVITTMAAKQSSG